MSYFHGFASLRLVVVASPFKVLKDKLKKVSSSSSLKDDYSCQNSAGYMEGS